MRGGGRGARMAAEEGNEQGRADRFDGWLAGQKKDRVNAGERSRVVAGGDYRD